jgi:hypothetical protein
MPGMPHEAPRSLPRSLSEASSQTRAFYHEPRSRRAGTGLLGQSGRVSKVIKPDKRAPLLNGWNAKALLL